MRPEHSPAKSNTRSLTLIGWKQRRCFDRDLSSSLFILENPLCTFFFLAKGRNNRFATFLSRIFNFRLSLKKKLESFSHWRKHILEWVFSLDIKMTKKLSKIVHKTSETEPKIVDFQISSEIYKLGPHFWSIIDNLRPKISRWKIDGRKINSKKTNLGPIF